MRRTEGGRGGVIPVLNEELNLHAHTAHIAFKRAIKRVDQIGCVLGLQVRRQNQFFRPILKVVTKLEVQRIKGFGNRRAEIAIQIIRQNARVVDHIVWHEQSVACVNTICIGTGTGTWMSEKNGKNDVDVEPINEKQAHQNIYGKSYKM
jgi:hypothetical protein